MEYILFNKNTPVCKLAIAADGMFEKVIEIYHADAAPVGVDLQQKGTIYAWWKGRSIPASRAGLSKFLHTLQLTSTMALPFKSFGLSLSDQYWLKPIDMDVKWADINFFEHDFSADVGEAFFNPHFNKQAIDFMTPDNTSDGWLRKKWIRADGKICLVKTGSEPFRQESYNEVIAAYIANKMGFNHVEYSLLEDETQGSCSICENFIHTDTELVSAYALLKAHPKNEHQSLYEYFCQLGDKLGIKAMRSTLENMIVLDYLMANTDRHLGNFGVIRDCNSLRYLGVAPIYDSGTSLWHDKLMRDIGKSVDALPFAASHEIQLQMVRDWTRFNFTVLDEVSNYIENLLQASPAGDAGRAHALAMAFAERLQTIKLHQKHALKQISNVQYIAELKQLQFNLEPAYIYYHDKYVGIGKHKYNPETDKELAKHLQSDGFSHEQILQILCFSPNIKNVKMAETIVNG